VVSTPRITNSPEHTALRPVGSTELMVAVNICVAICLLPARVLLCKSAGGGVVEARTETDANAILGLYCSEVRGVVLLPAVSFLSPSYDHPVVDPFNAVSSLAPL
jgi:hypothetical protein